MLPHYQQIAFTCAYLAFLPLAVIDASAEQQSAGSHSTCMVTRPSQSTFVPPAQYPQTDDRFYFGSDKLWVSLYKDWAGVGLTTDKGYRVKFPWFANDISDDDVRVARLSITGRRLDGEAQGFTIDGPHASHLPDHRFFASTMLFPSAGCWEISAERMGSRMKLVVLIQ